MREDVILRLITTVISMWGGMLTTMDTWTARRIKFIDTKCLHNLEALERKQVVKFNY